MIASLSKRCAAEAIGTFAIVFLGCGSMATLSGSAAHLAINITFGLTVAAMIYSMGHISCAHYNPAVTLGFALVKRFPSKDVVPFLIAQCSGAVLASLLHRLMFGDMAARAHFGATIPKLGVAETISVEVAITFFLMFTIIATATDKRVAPWISGFAIGSTVALCGLFAGPLTGCSMNPARSLGPAMFAGGDALSNYWVYIIGPCIGACLAVLTYEYLRSDQGEVAKEAT